MPLFSNQFSPDTGLPEAYNFVCQILEIVSINPLKKYLYLSFLCNMAKQSQREKIEENVAGNPGFAQEKINLYFYPFSTVDTKIRILGYFREDISVPTLCWIKHLFG